MEKLGFKLGMWKGYQGTICQWRAYERGTFFCKKWYIRRGQEGLDLWAEPLHKKLCWLPPPPPHRIHYKILGPVQAPLHSCAEPNWWIK